MQGVYSVTRSKPPLRAYPQVRSSVEAVLEGGGAEVNDENLHNFNAGCACVSFNQGILANPATQLAEVVVRTWNAERQPLRQLVQPHLHLPQPQPSLQRHRRCRISHETGADFLPASHAHVSGLECRVARFHEADETLTFDHSNCLLSHGSILLLRINY